MKKYIFNSSHVLKINETCHRLTAGPKFPYKQVNKSVSLSIAPLFILSQSPEWREARERRQNDEKDEKYPCTPPVLPPSLSMSLMSMSPAEHISYCLIDPLIHHEKIQYVALLISVGL